MGIHEIIIADTASSQNRLVPSVRAGAGASHAQLLGIVMSAMDAVISIDAEQSVLLFNPAAEKMFGWSAAEMLGQPIERVIPPHLRAAHRKQILEFGKNGVTTRVVGKQGELSGLHRDGTAFPVEASISQVEVESGKIFTIIVRDITEAREAHAALERSEQRFRGLVENSFDGIALLAANGTILYGSASTSQILGYALDEFVGRNAFALIHPDDQNFVTSRMRLVLEQPRIGVTVSARVRHKSGAWCRLESILTNLLDEPGVEAIVNNYRDVTERREAEDAVRASEALTGSVLAAITVQLAVLDAQGTIVKVNPIWEQFARENGDSTLLSTGVGVNYLEVCRRAAGIHSEQASLALEGIQAVMDGTLPSFTLEYPCDSHQKKRWFVMYAVPLPYLNGALITHLNITERRNAEQSERDQRTLAEALRDTAAILNSTLELHIVAERILEHVGRVVPHDASTIMLIEHGNARVIGSRGYPAEDAAEIVSLRLPLDGTPNLQELVATGKPVLVADTHAYAGWRRTPVTAHQSASLAAPIRSKGKTIGVISLDSYTPNTFNEVDALRLLAFADQAGIALENARLFQETTVRLAELEAINMVSTTLRAAQKMDDMLLHFIEEVLALLHCEVGSIWIYDAVQQQVKRMAARGWMKDMPPFGKLGEGILGHVIETGQLYRTSEVQNDPYVNPRFRTFIPEGQSGVCVPIRTADQIVGALFVVVALPRILGDEELNLLTTITEMAGNTIHRMRLHQETERQLDRLASLRVIDRAISSSLDLGVTLQILLEQIVTRLKVDAAAILLRKPITNQLEYEAARGFRLALSQLVPVRLGKGLAGRVALERTALDIPDLAQKIDKSVNKAVFIEEGFASYYATPLIIKGTVTGVLELFERAPRAARPEWVDYVEAMAAQAAIAIDSAALFDNLQRSNLQLVVAYDETIEGWSRALDLRDKETEGHTQRVTEMTMWLARAAGIAEAELVHVRRGALLHDIGKMGVPDQILLKPGSLSAEEWVIMRSHPSLAYEMLHPIVYLRPALDIPYCHHEKLDGTGYPRGLKGDEIPLAARIFAVADVWDALRSDRPYRPAWSEEKTRAHMESLKGTHFDPWVVDLFLEMIQTPVMA